MHVGDDLLQSRHPHAGFLFAGCYKVEILAFAFEDDGEAPIAQRLVCVLLQAFRLTATPDRIDVVDGDCEEEGRRSYSQIQSDSFSRMTDKHEENKMER